MDFYAKVVADSISPQNVRLTTMELCYPRFILSELNTHRAFSRNSASSRAIPVAKMIAQVRDEPAMPIHWGRNQAGMQASGEVDDDTKMDCQTLWKEAARQATVIAQMMNNLGLHKQVANRILEPFQWMKTIVTATEWDNFFELRCHPDAQPEFQHLATLIRTARRLSTPKLLMQGEWHLPYVDWVRTAGTIVNGLPVTGKQCFKQSTPTGSEWFPIGLEDAKKASVARCARVSYLTHDGQLPDLEKDLDLYERLVGAVPLHASPAEHQARPECAVFAEPHMTGNFKGWVQHRKLIEAEMKNVGS